MFDCGSLWLGRQDSIRDSERFQAAAPWWHFGSAPVLGLVSNAINQVLFDYAAAALWHRRLTFAVRVIASGGLFGTAAGVCHGDSAEVADRMKDDTE